MLIGIEGSKAKPAELMLASTAVHMFAATILLDHNSTFGAGFLKEEGSKVSEMRGIKFTDRD